MIRTLLSAAAIAAILGVGGIAMPAPALAAKTAKCTSITDEAKHAACINKVSAQSSDIVKQKPAKKKVVKKKAHKKVVKKTKKPAHTRG